MENHPDNDPNNRDPNFSNFMNLDLPPPDPGWPWGSVPTPSTEYASTNSYIAPTYERPFAQPHVSSNSSSLDPSTANNAPKVAIPRTTHFDNRTRRRRSARACEPCRQRKIKCDGNKPICRQCAEHNVTCSYLDVKRVREQKQLGVLAKRVEQYESLLRELEPDVDGNVGRRIRKSLKSNQAQGARNSPDQDDESDVSTSSVGSLDAIDLVGEDLNRSEQSRATGYFGKNSEVSWMQKLEDEAEHRSRHPDFFTAATQFGDDSQARQDIPIAMMSYHLDDLSIPLVDSVDPYAVPPKELSDRFLNAYLESVHPSFNILRKPMFLSQYRQFFTQPCLPPRRWLAILNMIFAIGCRYCRFDSSQMDESYNDSVYLTRARRLSLGEKSLFEHADLQQVQLEFLVAFYLLTLGQVNRASKFSAMAFRSALSLGINLRFVDERTHYASKEARSRLWWSIYTLEHILTAITGRVSCVGEGLSSVSAPIPFEEEAFGKPEVQAIIHDPTLLGSRLKPTIFETETESKSNALWLATCEPSQSLFFYYIVDLGMLSQSVINEVYSIKGLRERNFQFEQRIRKYSLKMDSWLSKIPSAYRFTRIPNDPTNDQFFVPSFSVNQPFLRERVSLAMNYYSARITLCRPCLAHTNSRPSSPSPGTSRTHHHCYHQGGTRNRQRIEMALSCLRSSCSLISVLPNEPDPIWLIHISPWWNILHFIMQATTACLLGLSCWPSTPATPNSDKGPFQIEVTTVVDQAKKALRWLHQMAGSNAASRRAFILCDSFMRRIAPSLGVDVDDIPEVDSLPMLEGFGDGSGCLSVTNFGAVEAEVDDMKLNDD